MSLSDLKEYSRALVVPAMFASAVWAIFTTPLPDFDLSTSQLTGYGIRFSFALVATFSLWTGYLYVKLKRLERSVLTNA